MQTNENKVALVSGANTGVGFKSQKLYQITVTRFM